MQELLAAQKNIRGSVELVAESSGEFLRWEPLCSIQIMAPIATIDPSITTSILFMSYLLFQRLHREKPGVFFSKIQFPVGIVNNSGF